MADNDPQVYERKDNISQTAVDIFRKHHNDPEIDGDAVFFYTYGMLHHPKYLEDHKDSLNDGFPRLPHAQDFKAIEHIGYQLYRLHLNWRDICKGYKLNLLKAAAFQDDNSNHWRFTKVQYAKKKQGGKNIRDKTQIVVNPMLTIGGIPEEAHEYQLNDRSPLDWVVDRYTIKQWYKDPKTGNLKTNSTGTPITGVEGIINDPNDLFANPKDFVLFIEQLVELSLETSKLVGELGKLEYDDGLPVSIMQTNEVYS